MRFLILLAITSACFLPVSLCQVEPLVVIGCFDGQAYPPEFCPNYSRNIRDLVAGPISEAYGDEIEVVTVGDWFFFLDALSLPNVIGGVISLREGMFSMSQMRQEELLTAFENGLGLIGMNAMCYNTTMGKVAHAVFPVNGTKTVAGKIKRGTLVTSRHTHLKRAENEITAGLPEVMEIPDSSMFYNHPPKEEGWWTPEEGEMTVLYVSNTAVRDDEVPSIILYERESGRSVSLPGLRHTDAPGRYQKDLGWYNHSMAMPELRQLLVNSLVYVLEPFASEEPLKTRMEQSREFLEGGLQSLQLEVETAESALKKHENRAMTNTLLMGVLAILGVVVVAYLGFLKK
jgi:hypothetical protein